MLFWPTPNNWVALGFPGCFLNPIELTLPFWVSSKVIGASLSLQTLNLHNPIPFETYLDDFCPF